MSDTIKRIHFVDENSASRYSDDMIQTQISLPEEVYSKLTQLAEARNEPMEHIVEKYVTEGITRDQQTLQGDVHSLVTLAQIARKEQWGGNAPQDLSINHDRYFTDAVEKDGE